LLEGLVVRESITTDPRSPLRLPPGFVWGAATSSHQVEGHTLESDWWAWETEQPHRIRGGRPSGAGAGWWAHGWAERDLSAARTMGHTAHRLSLEWSRLAPAPGRRSKRAIERYRAVLGHAKSIGLQTFVTLHHFTLPKWVARAGGWVEPETVRAFAEHGRASVRELGDLVDAFFTINEPTVLALKAYAHGMWPPGRRVPYLASRAVRQQLRGHAAAYHAIKAISPTHPVGLAVNLPSVEPARASDRFDRQVSRLQDWMVNGSLLSALRTGWCRPPVGNRVVLVPELAGSFDFVGVNYYGRYRLRFSANHAGRLFGRYVQANSVKTESADWGEPSPSGFVQSLERAAELGVPVYVSENGVYDPRDVLRPRYIVEHVRALARAVERGLDVRGYFHWSLIDNFEWAQGWTTPFGLIGMDPHSHERRVRRSAIVYSAIARHNGLPRVLAEADDADLAHRPLAEAFDPYG